MPFPYWANTNAGEAAACKKAAPRMRVKIRIAGSPFEKAGLLYPENSKRFGRSAGLCISFASASTSAPTLCTKIDEFLYTHAAQ
jgi:hypothetical protein